MPVNFFTVTLKDHLGNKLPVTYSQDNLVGAFTDKSDNWKVFLEKYSNAQGVSRSDGETHPLGEVVVANPGDAGFDLVGNKAVLNFRRKGGPLNLTDAKPMRISIPAAKSSIFEKVPGKKDMQVIRAIGEQMAQELSNHFGEEITFVDGSQHTK